MGHRGWSILVEACMQPCLLSQTTAKFSSLACDRLKRIGTVQSLLLSCRAGSSPLLGAVAKRAARRRAPAAGRAPMCVPCVALFKLLGFPRQMLFGWE